MSEMKFCRECGAQILAGGKFCEKCGTNLIEAKNHTQLAPAFVTAGHKASVFRMKARSLVVAALILVVVALVAAFAPLVSQVLYTPVTTSYTTSYTTMSPYTVRHVEVADDPHDVATRQLYGDIESVTYERVGESLRINVTLSQPLSGQWVFLYIYILSDPTEPVFRFDWLVEFDHSVPSCELWKPVSFTKSIRVMSLEPCVMKTETVGTDVPLSAIGHPTKLYPQASIVYFQGGEALAMMSVDDAPDDRLPRPEVDLSPDYSRTLTRTFETYFTVIATNSSAYTVKVPLGVSVGVWLPVVTLAVAACLFLDAIYVSHKRATTLPSPHPPPPPPRGVCAKCGTTNTPTSKFCNECGARLPH